MRVHGKSPQPYVPMKEAIRFLMEHDYLYGSGFAFDEPLKPQSDTGIIMGELVKLTQNYHAMLTVKSPTMEGQLHMVVWNWNDGFVYDPIDGAKRTLDNYEIIEWANILPLVEV